MTNDKEKDVSPLLSPDGKSLAFIRNNRELLVLDLSTGKNFCNKRIPGITSLCAFRHCGLVARQ
ncbi:MAG: hypothetical protein IPP73_12910 [Chitinophagaceae bacterium]|nr:hypothetical protein [Chitinophagaceae bacterium]